MLRGAGARPGLGPRRRSSRPAAGERAERLEVVRAERAAYRAAGATEWDIARAAAIKGQRAREVAWWTGLPEDERARRRAHWQDRYQHLSVSEQLAVKDRLARRRAAVGVDEREHHHAWVMWPGPRKNGPSAPQPAPPPTRHDPSPSSTPSDAPGICTETDGSYPARAGAGPTLAAEHAALTPDSAQARDAAYLAGDQLALPLSATSDEPADRRVRAPAS